MMIYKQASRQAGKQASRQAGKQASNSPSVPSFALIVAACNKPEAKPPTNIEKDKKADTDTDSGGESSGGEEDKTDTAGGEPADGDADKTGGESGGESVTPPPYSFAFDTASHKVAFTSGGTYTRAVVETNKPADDVRAIEYTSSETKIATVDDAGIVTFVTQGTVTITATKLLEGEYPEATARYTLYLTTKPRNKVALIREITRATGVHGDEVDLNYIDTSAITSMRWLFSSDTTNGYELEEFNGDISKWDVSAVTDMRAMFAGATSFNGDISDWKVSEVTNMFAMFQDATAFDRDISEWDVSEVTNMRSMFAGATAFDQNISKWVVSKVENMFFMFNGATSFDQDISRWIVSKVKDMRGMFMDATAFKHNLDAWSSRIHADIKGNRNKWANALNMFTDSGLANKLPSWCQNTNCRNLQ